jgi:hypothetical protein
VPRVLKVAECTEMSDHAARAVRHERDVVLDRDARVPAGRVRAAATPGDRGRQDRGGQDRGERDRGARLVLARGWAPLGQAA